MMNQILKLLFLFVKSREISPHPVIKNLQMRVLYTRLRQPHDITFSLLVSFVCTQLQKITGHPLNVWIKSDFCFCQSILYVEIHTGHLDLVIKIVFIQLLSAYSIVFFKCFANFFICFERILYTCTRNTYLEFENFSQNLLHLHFSEKKKNNI